MFGYSSVVENNPNIPLIKTCSVGALYQQSFSKEMADEAVNEREIIERKPFHKKMKICDTAKQLHYDTGQVQQIW